MSKVPDGVTVIIMLNDRVMASGSDFDKSIPGGWTPRDFQELRARKRAWANALNATCHPEVAAAIDGTRDAVTVGRALVNQYGWSEHVIVHGHERGRRRMRHEDIRIGDIVRLKSSKVPLTVVGYQYTDLPGPAPVRAETVMMTKRYGLQRVSVMAPAEAFRPHRKKRG